MEQHEWQRERRGAPTGDGLSRFLSLFSLGLGAAQLAAPAELSRMIGAPDTEKSRSLMRVVGVRELLSGFGLLAQPDNPAWLWLRAGGDIMDIALLSAAMGAPDADKQRLTATLAAVLGVTALDLSGGIQHTDMGHLPAPLSMLSGVGGPIDVTASITINKPASEVYQFWHNFENLPRFMRHLESVRVLDGRRSHWVASAPAGMSVQWDAEMTEDRPNELISWRAIEGADVPNSGSVQFKPAGGDRGTVVHVNLQYSPPGGPLGAAVARLFGEEPSQQVHGDLRRFKQVLETGEVVVSSATVDGPNLFQRPAQPPEHYSSNYAERNAR
jgi:uncharacterized membrane protein